MTLGEKIQYCRKNRLKISQAQLAKTTGINITTIKLYENNKMIPSQTQAQKIADALGIGVGVLTDPVSGWNFKLETYGDLIKLIMVLRKNRIVTINGERGADGRLVPSTVTFSLAPVIGGMFQTVDTKLSGKDTLLSLKSSTVLENLLKWESLFTKFEELSEKYKNDPDAKSVLRGIEDDLDVIELEMQFNDILLERVENTPVVKLTSNRSKSKQTRAKKQPKKNGDDAES